MLGTSSVQLAAMEPTRSFVDEVWLFMFGPGTERLVFVTASFVVGFLIIIGDKIYQAVVRVPSLIGLGPANPILMIVFWPLGAAIAALLSHAFGLVQHSMQASVVVGAAWTILLPKLIARANFEAGGPVEEPVEEDEEV